MITEISIKVENAKITFNGENLSGNNGVSIKKKWDSWNEDSDKFLTSVLKEYPNISNIQCEIEEDNIETVYRLKWNQAYIAIVNNADDLSEANGIIDELYNDENFRIEDLSSFYNYIKSDGEKILSGCIKLKTLYSSDKMWEVLSALITDNTKAYILLFNEEVIDNKDVLIPYEGLKEKLYLLEPMADIGSYALEPVLNKRISVILDEMKNKSGGGCSGCSGCSGCNMKG